MRTTDTSFLPHQQILIESGHRWCGHFIKELKQQHFWATDVNRKWTFCIIGQWFCSNSRLNRLYKRKGTQRYKFISVNAYNKGEGLTSGWTTSLKTPLLKLPILCAVIDLSFLKVKRPSVDSTVDVTSATVHRTQKHRIQRITLVLSLFIYRVT